MKYLEKYIFRLLPDITQLQGFPDIINDDTIADYFSLSDIEKQAIQKLHKKKYTFTYQ